MDLCFACPLVSKASMSRVDLKQGGTEEGGNGVLPRPCLQFVVVGRQRLLLSAAGMEMEVTRVATAKDVLNGALAFKANGQTDCAHLTVLRKPSET